MSSHLASLATTSTNQAITLALVSLDRATTRLGRLAQLLVLLETLLTAPKLLQLQTLLLPLATLL